MNSRRICLLALCAALLYLTALLAGREAPGKKEEAKGLLRVGVREDVEGFSCRNAKTGRYYGLEVDLAKALAERLGYDGAAFVSVNPQTREQLLESGEVDCVIACFSVNAERRERLDFSEPYYTDELKILVENSSQMHTVRALRGCTIAVLQASDVQQEAERAFAQTGLFDGENGVRFVAMQTYDEMSAALDAGDVDALCLDGCIAWGYYDDDRSFVNMEISEQVYGVATRKGSPLSAPIDEAMRALLNEGLMDRLTDKWL